MGKKKQKAAERSDTARNMRDIPALSFRAEIAPSSIDADQRTFDVVWTTGARVLRGFFDRFWEELSLDPEHVRMERLASGRAPLLNAHQGFSLEGQLGKVQSARIEGNEGTAKVRFASAGIDERTDKIFRLVEDKIIQNVSVGYRVHKLEKTDESVDEIPVRLATDWEPHEISLVPIGADAGAGVRSDSATTNPCEFVGLDQETRDMAIKVKDNTPTPAPAATPTDVEIVTAERSAGVELTTAEAEATKTERQRGISIRAVGAKLECDDELVRTHIDKGTTPAEFRTIAIDAYERAEPEGVSDSARPSITLGEDETDKWRRHAGHWIMQRAAVGGIVEAAAKQRGDTLTLDPGMFRGMTMMDMAKAALKRNGVNTEGRDVLWIAGEALSMRSGGFQATGDFPVILENTLHKTLRGQFIITPDTWRDFCRVGSVSDFRDHPRYRMATFNVLPLKLEGAEYVNQAQADGEKESIAAVTRGSIVQFTREMLINDDMSAFTNTATSLGRASALTIESRVYTRLAENSDLGPNLNDGNPLFDAAHNNLGAGAALSSAAIDANSVIMESQTLPGGVEIASLRPSILLIPRGLKSTAIKINESVTDPDTSGDVTPNTTNGMFDKIVATTRLSGTRRYLFADPNEAAVLEVAFLNGQQNPSLETENGFRRDGVSWKVRIDFGVAGVGERGAVTDAGA